MDESIKKQFIIGLPSAGKTTFLSALWHVVETNELDHSLKLDHLDGDYSYLNYIRDLWADSKKIPRNKLEDEHIVSMHLFNPENNNTTEVFFPDLSGEAFQLQWTDRQVEKTHLDMIKESSGCLLFIHPDHVIEETLISEANKFVTVIKEATQESDNSKVLTEDTEDIDISTLESEINNRKQIYREEDSPEQLEIIPDKENESPHTKDSGTKTQEKEYDSINAPTQVQLVDILQIYATYNTTRPIKIAIIVSAWDLIESYIKPSDWVAKHLPLLKQFLFSNNYIFTCNFYGISAQGGSLEDASRLREFVKQSEKIKVFGNDNFEQNDITAPIKWIMG